VATAAIAAAVAAGEHARRKREKKTQSNYTKIRSMPDDITFEEISSVLDNSSFKRAFLMDRAAF